MDNDGVVALTNLKLIQLNCLHPNYVTDFRLHLPSHDPGYLLSHASKIEKMTLESHISKKSQGHKVTGIPKKCLFVMIRGIFADYTSRNP